MTPSSASKSMPAEMIPENKNATASARAGDCKDPFENCHAPSLTKSASENIALRSDLDDRAVILEDDCPIREIH